LAGNYNVTLGYCNGLAASSISIYVNGVKIKQSLLPITGTWDTWGTVTEVLTLNAGTNAITYKYDTGDGARINLDYISINVKTTTSIQLSQEIEEVMVYPNPAVNNTFTVELKNANFESSIIYLYNNYGEQVYSTKINGLQSNQITLPMSFASGIYFLKIGKNYYKIII